MSRWPLLRYKPFAGARIVDDILRQPLADDEADERLGAVVDGLMSRHRRLGNRGNRPGQS